MLICPVFWKGELFCWVTNCLHQYDLGGITPSSFCGSAENAFEEGICIPPVKIIENNEIRRDIEELYLRSSRKPEAVALDFRAHSRAISRRATRARAHQALRVRSGEGRDAQDPRQRRARLSRQTQTPARRPCGGDAISLNKGALAVVEDPAHHALPTSDP